MPLSKVRLSTLLIIVFCMQLGVTVGLVGYFALRSGERAVEDVSKELSTEITRRIQERLKLHLEIPHLVNQFNANALAANIVSLDDFESFQELLLRQVQAHEAINNTYIGTTNGDFFGVERNLDSDGFSYLLAGPSTEGSLWIAETDFIESLEPSDLDNLAKMPTTILPGFDPRKRPWYQVAIAQDGPAWSDVYRDFSSGELTITASQPVRDDSGSIIGVLGSDFLFSTDLNIFLENLQIGESGEVFILDQQGNLIATSTALVEQSLDNPDAQNAERDAQNSENSSIESTHEHQRLLDEATRYLIDFNQGDLTQIKNIEQLSFTVDQTPYFLQATPLTDDRGINWIILVVIPKSDFLGPLYQSTRFILLLCGAALLISSLVAIIMARKINRPLSNIIQASKRMVEGNLNQHVPEQGVLETNALAISFNQMADQLRDSFNALSENEKRFRSLIDNIPGVIYRCRNDQNWTMEFVSDSIQEITGYPASDFLHNQVRTFSDSIHPSDRQRVAQVVQSAINARIPYQIEYRLKRDDGHTRWVSERGQGTFDADDNLLYLDGAIFDITEQKQAQDILREQEETIHAIVNAIPDLLIRMTVEGVELDVLGNRTFSIERAPLKQEDSHTPQRRIEDVLPPDLAQQRIEFVRKAIQTNQIQRYEQYRLHTDSSPRHEEVRVTPLNANEALVIIRDTTETKKIEEALQELSAANRIQANMLPDYSQLCESIAQIDLVATMTPAKNVGGDFFDVFALDHRYLCITIGDVSGKGIPAALFMVRAMTLLRMAVDTGMSLNKSVSKVNQLLCVNNLDCMFVTLFVGLLDVYTGELRYVSCGHNPPFLCAHGKTFEIMEPPQGILMGVYEEAEYEVGILPLQKDDVLVLYTDGVTEAESASHEYFSTERTLATLNSVSDRTQIQSLVKTLQANVEQFSKGVPQSDDITILALRYLGNEDMEPEKFTEIELEWLVQNLKLDAPHKF